MIYKFFRRLQNSRSKEVASVELFSNGDKIWSGDVESIQKILDSSIGLLGGQFDEDNEKHWKLLPYIFSGSRLWVVVEPKEL